MKLSGIPGRRFTLAALVLFCLPQLALAGGHALLELATPEGATQQFRLEYQGERLRLQRPGDDHGYLLVRDGALLAVRGKPRPTAVASVGALPSLDTPEVLPAADLGLDRVVRFVCLDDTGRSETVAGIDGRVHWLSYRDAAGELQREALMLSSDPRARELSRALQRLAQAVARDAPQARPPGARQLAEELVARRLGLLRFGTQFRALELDDVEPQAARFEPSAGAATVR